MESTDFTSIEPRTDSAGTSRAGSRKSLAGETNELFRTPNQRQVSTSSGLAKQMLHLRPEVRETMKSITIPCLAMILLSTPGIAGNDKNYTYLALGDSVPFGMNITLLPPYSQQTPTPAQFVGYPEAVAAATRLLESKKEANASCPGETSGSFLNTSVPDYGCNSPHYQAVGPAIPPFKTTIES